MTAATPTGTSVVVGATIRFIYLIEDPNVKYIPCGFCTGSNPYRARAIDPSFMTVHMLECHKLELVKAPVVSHDGISRYYSLEARAILITELVRQSNYMPAGWLAVRVRKCGDIGCSSK